MIFSEKDYELLDYRAERDKSGRFALLWLAIILAIAALMWTKTFALICLGCVICCVFGFICIEPKIIPEQYIIRFKREVSQQEWEILKRHYYVVKREDGAFICIKKEKKS